MQGKTMTNESAPTQRAPAWPLIAYAVILALALGFDLLTDRSFGALMLAVLPISLIALVSLVVGPGLEGLRRAAALRSWTVGAVLVLVISIAFALLGADQAKTGELIFAYAVLLMALPGSLVLPWVEPLLWGGVITRIISAWVICAAAGLLEWKALRWLYDGIQQRIGGK
jgi:hypothetical protein